MTDANVVQNDRLINSSDAEETTTYHYTERTVFLSEGLHLDVEYLKTLPGLVKCIAIALDVLCFITLLIIGRVAYFSGAFWSLLVCSTAITVSLTLLVLYLFHIVDVIPQIPWIVSEMIYCFSWTIFYFMVGSVLMVTASTYEHLGFGIASLFAFGAMSTYGFDCLLKFLSWKRGEVAHGGGQNLIYNDRVHLSRNRERNENI